MKIPIRQEKADYYTAVEKTAKAMKNGTYKVPINEITAEFLGDVDAKYVMFKNGRFITDTGTGINPETWHTLDPVTAIGMAGGEPRPSYSQINDRIKQITDAPYSLDREGSIIFEKRLSKDILERVKNEFPYYQVRQPKSRLQKAVSIGVLAGLGIAGGAYAGAYAFSKAMQDDDNDGIPRILDAYPDVHNDKMNDSDYDGLSDYDEKIHCGWERSIDCDMDYVSDRAEINQYGTDPLKSDTDSDGINDFHEIFTYPNDLDPNDPTDAQGFIEKITEAKAEALYPNTSPETIQSADDLIKISEEDPVTKYYANRTEIVWNGGEDNIKGKIYVDGKPMFSEYMSSDEAVVKEIGPGIPKNPSWMLTHGGKGSCWLSSITTKALLKMNGYEPKLLMGFVEEFNPDNPQNNISHAWVEVNIDGKDWVVDFGDMHESEEYYKNTDWHNIHEAKIV